MSRIHTNAPAMEAQKNLHRADNRLTKTMQRLSTGLRINTAADDPSGLVAANGIRSDIASSEQAISNSERSTLVITTADAYLAKVSEQLDDIKALVADDTTDPAEIEANQLVLDAAVQEIDRIAKTATFQGMSLLDGSLAYSIDGDSSGNFSYLTDIDVQQALHSVYQSQEVRVTVTEAADQAQINFRAEAATTLSGGLEAFTKENQASQNQAMSLFFDQNTLYLSYNGTGEFSGAGNGSEMFNVVLDDAAYAAGSLTAVVDNTGNLNFYVGMSSAGGAYADYSFTADEVAASITGVSYAGGLLTATVVSDSGNTARMYAGPSGTLNNDESSDLVNELAFGGGFARVSLGHAVKLDPGDIIDTSAGTPFDTESLVFRRVDGTELDVALTIVTNIGDEEIVVQNDNEYAIDILDTNANATTAKTLAEEIQEFIVSQGYGEELYVTYESNSATTGTGTAPTGGESATGSSSYDYLVLTGIDGGEDVNNLTVALEFGSSDNVSYSASDKELTITLSSESSTGANAPDWSTIETTLQGLGELDSMDFSNASFAGLTAAGNHLGVLPKANYEMEGSTGGSGGYVLRGDSTFKLEGSQSYSNITLGAGSTRQDVVDAINLVSGTTGVSAEMAGSNIAFKSIEYGADADITITMTDEQGHFSKNLDSHYAQGKDAVGSISGYSAVTDGNRLRISNSTLQAEIRVRPGVADSASFSIRAGGGATFQLGADVRPAEQASVSFGSVGSADLGNGEVGYLYMLTTGGKADLATDKSKASQIAAAAGAQVDNLSARLGAFQANTLATNVSSLEDAVDNMKLNEGLYRDADYAYETSEMSKEMMLVEANTAILSIANQYPLNVLELIK